MAYLDNKAAKSLGQLVIIHDSNKHLKVNYTNTLTTFRWLFRSSSYFIDWTQQVVKER